MHSQNFLLCYCRGTSMCSRKPLYFEALLLEPGSTPWSILCPLQNMCVPFTFCSLVLMAEGSLLEAHIWSKKSFQPQERRTWRVWFYTHRTVCFYILHKLCEQQKSTRELSKSLFLRSRSHFCVPFLSWISFRGLSACNVVYTQRTNPSKSVGFWSFLTSFVRSEICLVRSSYLPNKICLTSERRILEVIRLHRVS